MTTDVLLQAKVENPDFETLTGSKAYGTERYNNDGECISDTDVRGFAVPPLDYLLGLRKFEEMELEGDHKIWSLKKFIDMLMKGNMQALECVFMPPSLIRKITPVGQMVLDAKELFVSKLCYRAAVGFSASEWYKVRGVKQVPIERSFDEKKAIDMFRNVFKDLPKDKWDDILTIAYSDHERKLVDAKQDVGEKRRNEYGLYGYCASCAHHALRLLYQCEELLLHGHMTFPRPEKVLLATVKRGELPFEEIEKLHTDIRSRVDRAAENSAIPERADSKAINRLYRKIVVDRVLQELLEEMGQSSTTPTL
jgi:hypothetical protein